MRLLSPIIAKLHARLCPRSWSAMWLLLLVVCSASAPLANAERTLQGESCLSLKEIARSLGLSLKVIVPQEATYLEGKGIKLKFQSNKRDCMVQDVKVVLGFPATLCVGDLYISKRDYEGTLLPILLPQRFRMPHAGKVHRVVIDPGHGGKDQGAENKSMGLVEKKLALDLAQRLCALLKSKGYEVILTRTEDVFVGLEARSLFSNKQKADLFISVHFNTAPTPQAHGVETFALTSCMQVSSGRSKLEAEDRKSFPGNQWDPWNVLLGFYMQRALIQDLEAQDRGLKRARFVVLKDLACPGVLIEGGFLTNPQEAKKIQDPAYRQKIAIAIAEGVDQYHQTLKRLASQTPAA
ncbi:MAG: hypothetical protein B7X06_01870 [Verrucomicrobia bacterium 21-51-4]|nr:MAG: hypothetical protein B7X06_01870 [Verrucomicrobia bacterium 21-51-4]HQU09036.1 N-acetylmuramoyl-L-alanine amidase [Opitutales bacterium]